jgi:hypothetical protein
VTRTASLEAVTPRSNLSRASDSNRTCLDAILAREKQRSCQRAVDSELRPWRPSSKQTASVRAGINARRAQTSRRRRSCTGARPPARQNQRLRWHDFCWLRDHYVSPRAGEATRIAADPACRHSTRAGANVSTTSNTANVE